ncbi:TonB-dependent receptor [Aurantiacibacter xanthus]|nr:TonB-dependent receptor [Aurantiacibacter xanthus]
MAQDSGESSGQVTQIVVTAEFRESNLQETPLAITAATAEMIAAKGQTGIAEVATAAPSVTLNAGGGPGGAQTTQINIRGIGQTDFNLALEPGVGIYIDDVYQGIMYASTPELLDLERVEILRGPQGTLSGRNSIGGAIRLITKAPNNYREGYAEASYGSFNALMVRAGFNVPLVEDRLFLRVNGLAKHSDGYVDRLDYRCATGSPPSPGPAAGSPVVGDGCKIGEEGGQSVIAVRASLRAILSDTIENTLSVDYMDDNSQPSGVVLIGQKAWRGEGYNLNATPPITNPTANFMLPYGSYANYSNYTTLISTSAQYTLPAASLAKTWSISNNLAIDITDAISLRSITGFKKIDTSSAVDLDGSPIGRNTQAWQVDHEQFTQELRLSGYFGDAVDWTLGAYYYHADSLQSGRAGLDGAGATVPFYVPFDFAFSDPVEVRSKAAFAHVVLHPTDAFSITGGLRYTKDTKDYTFSRFIAPGAPVSFLSASVLPLDGQTGSFSGDNLDWRLAVDYEITPDLLLYAQASTGFKGGGVNPRPYYVEQITLFDPETVTSYEAGLKSDLLDGNMRLNLAVYQNDYSNLQLQLRSCPNFVPTGAAPNCAMTANVGSARIRGIELEGTAYPVADLALDVAASYTDFEYRSVQPVTGVTLNMRAPYTPEWKLSAGVQYTASLGGSGSLIPRLDVRYQSQVETQTVNTAISQIDGYVVADASLRWQNADEDFELYLRVKNLFDEYYFVNITDFYNAPYGFISGQPGRPREFMAGARIKF